MSKNVAVFVDVANIFYAAKAAGVDIDYVTLLKSATAGRDFVRAYAYTGLDPENDNQRNFHDFLKRSGYKVVSKDIRKYGDGRIKANLDIELVVDLMRLAQHLDIAVVVSGDGDFAPAIRAVQQMGVRVEVISFRGNTSSDLVEVADDFYEISQIARVEKGARSGRRVASEDDLSMTAVPEKETDMGPRRRRTSTGRRDGRDEGMAAREGRSARAAATVVADTGLPGNVIVLPGERLSRAVGGAEDEEPTGEAETGEVVAAEEAEEHDGDGRRRRRRRGGRGRGRGRRAEGEAGEIAEGADLVGVAAAEGAPEDEDEYLDEELPTLPQHSTFGSVWDTQIGLPSQPVSAAQGTDQDVDDEDEPEIPEYLLAERRQQARGGRQAGRGGRQAGRGGRQGYQSAVDRERYGRSGSSMYGGARMPAPRPQGGGGGNRQGGGGQQQRRPQPQPAPQHRQRMDRDIAPAPASASAEPWSEVPAEVQELLRAELARRQGSSPTSAAPPARSSEPAGRPTDTRGSRGTRRAPTPIAEAPAAAAPAASAEIPVEAVEAPAAEAVEAAPRTTRRRTSTRSTAATADQGSVVGTPEAAFGARSPAEEGPAPKPTRRRTTKAAAEAPVAAAEAPTVEEGPAPKPARRRTTKAAAAAETAEAPVSSAEEAPTPKPTRRRSTKSSSTETPEG